MIGEMLDTVAYSRVVVIVIVIVAAASVADTVVVELFRVIVAKLFDALREISTGVDDMVTACGNTGNILAVVVRHRTSQASTWIINIGIRHHVRITNPRARLRYPSDESSVARAVVIIAASGVSSTHSAQQPVVHVRWYFNFNLRPSVERDCDVKVGLYSN
jgi:hypothetical protein